MANSLNLGYTPRRGLTTSSMKLDKDHSLSSKGALLAGFGAIVALLLIIATLSILALDQSVSNVQQVTEKTGRQKALLNMMHNSSRDRIITLYQMSIANDPFYQDELWLKFNKRGTDYITSRNALYSLDIDETLRKLLQSQDQILMPLGSTQLEIAELLIAGDNQSARDKLINDAAPLQYGVLEYFHEMDVIVEEKDTQAIQESFENATRAKTSIMAFAILGFFFIISVAVFVFRRVHNYEQKILSDKERAQVTLHSIVDGVIIINNQGYITELNDAAINMLNMPKEQILNRHIHDVIKLETHEDDHKPNPLELDSVFNQEVVVSGGGVDLVLNNGNHLVIEYSLSPIVIDRNVTSAVLVMHDITSMHNLARKLDYQASHDSLTGIYNRRKFEELLEKTLTDARRYSEAQSWLCYIDLDRFKEVNDTCGHLAGDQFLVQVANQICSAVRDRDYVSRMGGDEFAVILRFAGSEEALVASERIRSHISELEFICGSHHFDVTASLGLVSLDKSVKDVNTALNYADTACYQSKHAGRNQLSIYKQS